jgi:hypothetical protein
MKKQKVCLLTDKYNMYYNLYENSSSDMKFGDVKSIEYNGGEYVEVIVKVHKNFFLEDLQKRTLKL